MKAITYNDIKLAHINKYPKAHVVRYIATHLQSIKRMIVVHNRMNVSKTLGLKSPELQIILDTLEAVADTTINSHTHNQGLASTLDLATAYGRFQHKQNIKAKIEGEAYKAALDEYLVKAV